MRARRLLALLVLAGATGFACAQTVEHSTSAGPLLNVGFLALPGLRAAELAAPYDVLQRLRQHVKGAPDVFTVAPRAAPLTSAEGLVLTPAHAFADAPPIDLLVVPSAARDDDLRDETLIDWVRTVGQRAKLLLALGDGVVLLAQAGLLDGLEATTSAAEQERLAARFARVRVRRDALLVHDGKALTSVGGARGFEAALYLVERVYGAEAARRVARELALGWDVGRIGLRRARGAREP